MTRHIQLADLTIDLDRRETKRGDETLDLRGLTFDLFAVLLRGEGETVGLDRIVADVWQGEPVSNEVITQRVRLLRRALGDDPAAPRYVETVRQKGYRICAVVTPSMDTVVEKRGRWPWLLAGVGSLCLIAAVWWRAAPPAAENSLVDRARYYSRSGQAEDNLRAIELYELALREQPDDYRAQLGLSFAYAQRVCRHDAQPQLAVKAKALAATLVARDERDVDALEALAYAHDCAGDIDLALAGYLRAYDVSPKALDALGSAAHLLQVRGELADALARNLDVEARTRERPFRYTDIQIARCLELMTFDKAAAARYARTVTLHPDNLFAAAAYVRFLMARGQLDEARAAVARSIRLGAANADLLALDGELALLSGDKVAAARAFTAAIGATQTSSWPQTLLDLYGPQPAAAQSLQNRIRRLADYTHGAERWPGYALELALLRWHQGDQSGAYDALTLAVDYGFRDVAYLASSPVLAPLRTHAAYPALAQRVRTLAADERDRALAASWWRPELMAADVP